MIHLKVSTNVGGLCEVISIVALSKKARVQGYKNVSQCITAFGVKNSSKSVSSRLLCIKYKKN